jgi:endonuclease YncB( thermonuclease family)
MVFEVHLALSVATQTVPPIYGIATSGDGDSITISGKRIRLFGIDAPEFDQVCTRGSDRWACGQESANQLSKLVMGREVKCVPTGTDDFARIVARCSAGGVDINRTMVALGYAVAFRKYSTEYVSAEDAARNNKRGMWSGNFAMPSEVRTNERQRIEPTQRSAVRSRPQVVANACNVKGNRTRRGDWIYHIPGMPYYEQTQAEEVFCSEADARAAGYRRARVR